MCSLSLCKIHLKIGGREKKIEKKLTMIYRAYPYPNNLFTPLHLFTFDVTWIIGGLENVIRETTRACHYGIILSTILYFWRLYDCKKIRYHFKCLVILNKITVLGRNNYYFSCFIYNYIQLIFSPAHDISSRV